MNVKVYFAMPEVLSIQRDIALLQTAEDSHLEIHIEPGIILEKLSTALLSHGLQGLDSTGSLVHALCSQYSAHCMVTPFTAKLAVLVETLDRNSMHHELRDKEAAEIADLFARYNNSVTKNSNIGTFASIYKALMPIFPPLMATSVIMHANKKEGARCKYYDCPSLWAIFLLMEDVEEPGRKTSEMPPKNLFSCFTLFYTHSRCPIAHAVIGAFRFLLIYADIPGIQIILPADPTKRSNRAIDVMKNKCALMYGYILNAVDRSTVTSASKSAIRNMPDSLEEYIKALMCQLQARYKHLFSVSLLRDHKPIRPVKPITKNNRGGTRFNRAKKIIENRSQDEQLDV